MRQIKEQSDIKVVFEIAGNSLIFAPANTRLSRGVSTTTFKSFCTLILCIMLNIKYLYHIGNMMGQVINRPDSEVAGRNLVFAPAKARLLRVTNKLIYYITRRIMLPI